MSTAPPSFTRSLKMVGALFIILSVITPASSIFVIAPGVLQQAGSGAFLSFVAGAFACLFTAFVYAELSSAFPLTGGEYAIVGHILGPLAGFIILGINFVTLILVVTVLALGVSHYLNIIFVDLSPVVTGVTTVLIATLFAVLNIKVNALITGFFLALEMLALAIMTYLGFTHTYRPFSDLWQHPLHLGMTGGLDPTSLSLIGLSTSVAIFAYNGYGTAVYLGEEMHDASRQIARTILGSLFISIVAEALPVTAVLLGAPDLTSLFSAENPFSSFIAVRGGHLMNILMSLCIALAIINANIASMVIASRMLFSTGRDHVWTASINQSLSLIHKRYHSPWVATLICGVLASLACFINLTLLLVITGTTIVVVYGALCLAALVGRRNKTTSHATYRMPFFPLPPLLALVVLLYVIYANYMDVAIGRPSLWVTLGISAVSTAYYYFILQRRGAWVLHRDTN